MFSNFFESSKYAILKLVVMTVISFYTIIQLAKEAAEMRGTLAFQTRPITSRCIPLFRVAQQIYDIDPSVEMLYDYRSGTVDLRVCSRNLSRDTIISIVNTDPANLLDSASGCTRSQIAADSTTS